LQLGQVASLRGNPAATRVIPRSAISAILVLNHLKNDFVHKLHLSEEGQDRKRPLE
jgi:hypothetical protein